MEKPERELEVPALVKFFANPAKYFLEQRLKLRLPKSEEAVDDCEPLDVDGLPRWNLQNRLVRGGAGVPDDLRVWQAEGVLPAGWFGAAEFDDMAGQVERLFAAVGSLCAGGPLPPQPTRLADRRMASQQHAPGSFPGRDRSSRRLENEGEGSAESLDSSSISQRDQATRPAHDASLLCRSATSNFAQWKRRARSSPTCWKSMRAG